MALTVTEILEAIAPELTGDARIDTFTTLAAQRLDAAAWGAVYIQAVAYLVAHMMTLSPAPGGGGGGSGGTAGPITAKSAGDLSESYGSVSLGSSGGSLSDAILSTTSYGRTFVELRNSRAARAPTVIDSGT